MDADIKGGDLLSYNRFMSPFGGRKRGRTKIRNL